jgi:heat shock protein HslJ
MKNSIVLIVVFAFIMAVSSCQSHKKNAGSSKASVDKAVIMQKDTFSFKGTIWKLVELNGKPVKDTVTGRSEAFIIFSINDSTFNGSGGCNRFFGNYELKENNLLYISHVGMTKMACIDAVLNETELLTTLEKVNLFTKEGKTLTLYRAVKAPLAKFEAVNKEAGK